jgi:hypothetical protein
MATAVQEPSAPASGMAGLLQRIPEDRLKLHEEDRQRRKREREKKLPVLIECLDADTAAKYEGRKPRKTYRVRCDHIIVGADGKRKAERLEAEVEGIGDNDAQREADAWARACDKWRTSPNRQLSKIDIKEVKA